MPGPGKGEHKTLALASLFSIAAKDFMEISDALQLIYEGKVLRTGKQDEILGKRKRGKRKPTKKSTYWTNKQLDAIEKYLVDHFAHGGTLEDVDTDKITNLVIPRTKKEVEKQLDQYRKLAKDDLTELPFYKAPNVKEVVQVDDDDMEIDSEKPKKKKRRSSKSKDSPGAKKSSTTAKVKVEAVETIDIGDPAPSPRKTKKSSKNHIRKSSQA